MDPLRAPVKIADGEVPAAGGETAAAGLWPVWCGVMRVRLWSDVAAALATADVSVPPPGAPMPCLPAAVFFTMVTEIRPDLDYKKRGELLHLTIPPGLVLLWG